MLLSFTGDMAPRISGLVQKYINWWAIEAIQVLTDIVCRGSWPCSTSNAKNLVKKARIVYLCDYKDFKAVFLKLKFAGISLVLQIRSNLVVTFS